MHIFIFKIIPFPFFLLNKYNKQHDKHPGPEQTFSFSQILTQNYPNLNNQLHSCRSAQLMDTVQTILIKMSISV